MLKKIQERIFPFLIALSALSVSASAAFYSVSGLSKLFAGATFAVIVMATSLEVSKLVIASLLYQYRKTLPKLLKVYLTIACVILIGITSMGIYGFLSAAYQQTANKDGLVTQQVEALETKKKLFEDNRNNIIKEKQSLANLKGTLSQGSTTQYTDKNGNLVVRSNNASIKQIETANVSDEKLSAKLDIVNDSIFSLETQILEVKTNGEAASELGPLKYLSELTDYPMNKIINWLLLVIIFVFDPLAISLVIAANFAFEKLKKKDFKEEQKEKIIELMKMDEEAGLYDDNIEPESQNLEDINTTVNKEFTNLDLDRDGIIEKEEINEIFDKADTNDDGFIDEEEAKQSNLDTETAHLLNKLNQSAEVIIDDVKKYYNLNSEEIASLNNRINEIKKLGIELGSLKNQKDDDNTITYF